MSLARLRSGTGEKRRDRSRLALALQPPSRKDTTKCGRPSTRPLDFTASCPGVPSAAPSPSQIHCSGSGSAAASSSRQTMVVAASSLTLMFGWRVTCLARKPTQQRQSADPLELYFRAHSSAKTWKAVLSEGGGAGAPASLRRSKAQRRASAPGWWWELRQGL